MKHCSTSGTLRAYLDNELPNIERLAVATHLQQCPECRADLDDIRIQAEQVALLLSPPNLPNADVALARIYATARPDAGRVPATQSRRTPMTSSQRIRRWAAPLVALVFAVALLAFPPVRAAADQLLQVLRVQTVVFVPITQERMEQLKNLNFDDKTLFLAEPKVINQPGEPQEVATADAASALVGFPVEQPANLPSTPTQTVFHVNGRTIAEFQINVASARELLKLTGVDDVTLPDALGAQPINVDMAPAVLTTYSGDGYTLQLIQGRAPQVNLPEGVDLRQLGRAALRVLGMAPEQADALSNQIDWSSTLLFPFPSDLSTVRQVSINGAPGLLTTGGSRGGRTAQLYWQRGDRFYVLELQGNQGPESVQILVQAAESVR